MKKLCLIVAAVLALMGVSAEPKPDFGVSGSIAAKPTVIELATATATQFADVKSETATITSGYTKLSTLYNALNGMAVKIFNKGNDLSVAIIALANANANYVSMFAAANTAVDNLSTVLGSGISAERAVITSTLTGNYVNNQLNIQIPKIVSDLATLKLSLTAMKNAVQQAATAAGGATVANIRKYVTIAITNRVLTDIGQLNVDIPALAFTVKNVIKNIKTADAFYKSMTPMVADIMQSVTGELDSFEFDLGKPHYAADVTSLDIEIGTDLTGYPLAGLQALSTYGSNMGPAYTTIQNLGPYATNVNPAVNGFFTTYMTNIRNFLLVDTNLSNFFRVSTMPVVEKVIQVLINSGGYSGYCYNRYAPQISKLFFVDLYNISECLRVELERFEKLVDAFETLISIILYDYDDIVENMNACIATGAAGDCIGSIGAFYASLATAVTTKKGYLSDLIHYETDASLYRLKACFTIANHNLEFEVSDMLAAVANCETHGSN